MRIFETIDEIKAAATEHGSHWFEPQAIRFFRSVIESTVYKGKYFVSSEQYSIDSSRMYTIRKVTCHDGNFNISSVGEFQQYESSDNAIEHIKNYLN